MTNELKIQQIKREGGALWVLYENEVAWRKVVDEIVAAYIIYILSRDSEEVFQNINSRLK